MRRSQHTDQEIAFLLREAENGTAITAICGAAHVSVGTFYRWRRRFGGLPPAGVARLGEIERENRRLRREVAALRQALLTLTPPDLPPLSQARPAALVPSGIALHPFRGGHATIGRYASVRTAN